MNNTVGLDKLIPILLVYSAYSYISREDKPILSNIERARVIKYVIDDVRRSNAKSAITKAMRTCNKRARSGIWASEHLAVTGYRYIG